MQELEKKRKVRKKKTEEEVAAETSPYRAGRVLIAGHFAPEAQKALKMIAVEEDTTVQALLAEGIDMVFAKRGKPEIASVAPAAVPVEELAR
jgi:hypothetical protein